MNIVTKPKEVKSFHDNDNASSRNGAELLSEIEVFVRRFIYLPNQSDYRTLALWIVYTHAYDVFDIAPRLMLWSPVKGNGKSTVLRLLNGMCRNPSWEVLPTEAGLFRSIDKNSPTLLLDEADKYIGQRQTGVLAVLNAGHMRGVTVTRNVEAERDMEPKRFDLFGPVAFAMKNRQPPEDLLDRSLVIKMQKAPASAKLEKFKSALHEKELQAIQKRIAEWTALNRDALLTASPNMAQTDRTDDNWFPLRAVAEVAGGNWPTYAKVAMQASKTTAGSTDIGLTLLAHIRQVFEDHDSPDHLLSETLVSELIEPEEWPWGRDPQLTVHKLAQFLDPFDIKPIKRRWSDRQARGYLRSDFEKAWQLYSVVGRSGTVGTLIKQPPKGPELPSKWEEVPRLSA